MNYFKALADQQMVAATKAKHRAAEKRQAKIVKSEKDAPMKLSEMEQKQADQSTQFRAYRAAKRREFQALLDGRHGMEWRRLIDELKEVTIDDVPSLPDIIERQQWLLDSDLDARHTALNILSGMIIRLRLENGYPPIDDSLPGEEPTAFEIIRKKLKVMT